MKSHAFVATSVKEIVNYKLHSDKRVNAKVFKKYFYFLFAPTLIYKDEYLR